MSYPVEADFAIVKIGDGATPQVFTAICGIENVAINQTVNTSDRFRRDCAKPGSVPKRKVRVTGSQWDGTGSGVVNVEEFDTFKSALGISKTYRIDFGKRDGTDAGEILGHYEGPAVMTAANVNMGAEEGTAEITLAGEDEIIWTAA